MIINIAVTKPNGIGLQEDLYGKIFFIWPKSYWIIAN